MEYLQYTVSSKSMHADACTFFQITDVDRTPKTVCEVSSHCVALRSRRLRLVKVNYHKSCQLPELLRLQLHTYACKQTYKVTL